MDWYWQWSWIAVCVVALSQACLTLLQTYEHRRFARSRLSKLPEPEFRGRVALFAPCKGLDEGLSENLRPLFEQDYPAYELTLIVESPDDPAVSTITRLMDEYPQTAARLVVAGRATESGQKVHNLRTATANLSPSIAILAFVDSDARPSRHWLRQLVYRLDRAEVGASTGYRWFIPQRPTLANLLLYSINSTVATLLGNTPFNLVWGGSWAIRRDVFESTGLHQAWYGTLSDDLVASRVLYRAGLQINFEPSCIVASPLNVKGHQLFEFVRRQYVIGRFYVPIWWATSVLVSTASVVALWGGLLIGLWQLWAGQLEMASYQLAICGCLWLVNFERARVRQQIGGICLPRHVDALQTARRFDAWAWPLVGLVNWLGLLSSMVGTTVTWRSICYQLLPGGRIRILNRRLTDRASSSNASIRQPHFKTQAPTTQASAPSTEES